MSKCKCKDDETCTSCAFDLEIMGMSQYTALRNKLEGLAKEVFEGSGKTKFLKVTDAARRLRVKKGVVLQVAVDSGMMINIGVQGNAGYGVFESVGMYEIEPLEC